MIHALDESKMSKCMRKKNTGSVRVLEKIGMQQVDYLREHKRIDGQAQDSLVFARLLRVGEPA